MKNITEFLNDIKTGELYEKYKEIQEESEILPFKGVVCAIRIR